MFADEQTVSKTMIKYACGITKESIVDVEGVVAVPANPIESATQKDVSCRSNQLFAALCGLVLYSAARASSPVQDCTWLVRLCF